MATIQLGPEDPTVGFKFTVNFDGVDSVGFSKISGLRASITPLVWTECTELLSPRKLPDVADFGPVVFERGVTENSLLFAKMRQLFALGRKGGFGPYTGFKKVNIHLPAPKFYKGGFVGAVGMQDPAGLGATGLEAAWPMHGFVLHYAWPIGLEADTLDAESSKILIHKLTVACEGISFI